MFLRSLYGSRMPQSRHPRANEQVSNYWSDDTESARELARLMSEIELSNEDGDDVKKPTALPAVVADSAVTASRRQSLLDQALLARLVPVGQLETLDSLNVDEMEAVNTPTQLSPTGLISIAAADIDEASRGNDVVSTHTDLDLEMLHTIRRAAAAANSNGNSNPAPRQILVENFMARMLAHAAPSPLSSSPSSNSQPAEDESPLRFLSLLRRINELRSQQVQHDADVWDGLPYPQILALPTFKYTVRERAHTELAEGCDDEHINNTMCAVCYTEYAPEEEVRALPCLHFYHRECIDQWLLHHRMCPICKHVVSVY